MRTPWTFFIGAVAVGTAVALLICGHLLPQRLAQAQADASALGVQRIAVMPFLRGKCGTDMTQTLDCPLARLSFDPENLLRGCDQTLTVYVQEAIQRRHGDKVLSLEEAKEVYQGLDRNQATDTPRSTAQDFGRAVGTSHVILGAVWRYKDRVGGSAAVQSPASVAFAVCLVDVASGKLVWRGRFVETQASLSDNILDLKGFLKKGAKWLSANDLARYGVNEIFQKYPL